MYGGRIIDPMMENNGSPEHLVGWVIVVESTQPQLNAHTLAHAHIRAHTYSRVRTLTRLHKLTYAQNSLALMHTHTGTRVYRPKHKRTHTYRPTRIHTHTIAHTQ